MPDYVLAEVFHLGTGKDGFRATRKEVAGRGGQMPKQEIFFEESVSGVRVEVLKSYDQEYAHEAFKEMGEEALQRLWETLKPEEIYDPAGLPSLTDPEGEGEAFLWDELLEQAREDGSLLSFFIVNETVGSRSESLYVSPDWTSAESFAKQRVEATR